ncbi:MAG: hypothetical protein IT423_19325 [Pirellulaceae bacterium]|nr:hypothetical protein [Pirellulaceae bacterium]
MKNSPEPTRQVPAALWAVAAAFGCYFCMYAFRKPFTAATFAGDDVWGLSFKTLLLTSQVAGYMVSKFIGVKVISEMRPSRRPRTILLLIVLAELALVLFGIVPRPWNAICLFLNGLPLGMVFGLILGQLEGRRATEALTAGLCTSFILADGVTKSVGSWLISQQVPEQWMPSAAGALFLLPLVICVAMLARIQPPTASDAEHRSERVTLDRAQRWSLLHQFAGGLLPLTLMYLFITILRSVRSDFAPELWNGLGVQSPPAIFTQSEMYVALMVIAINGSTVLIRDNALAFRVSLATCMLGMLILAGALIAWQNHWLSGFMLMVLIGQGLYLPYVAVHTTIFERLLAMTRAPGNIGFLMYIVDSVGYLGYVAVMLLKNFGDGSANQTAVFGYFLKMCWFNVFASGLCVVISWIYFVGRHGPAGRNVKQDL